jgi:hypothetical protein
MPSKRVLRIVAEHRLVSHHSVRSFTLLEKEGSDAGNTNVIHLDGVATRAQQKVGVRTWSRSQLLGRAIPIETGTGAFAVFEIVILV